MNKKKKSFKQILSSAFLLVVHQFAKAIEAEQQQTLQANADETRDKQVQTSTQDEQHNDTIDANHSTVTQESPQNDADLVHTTENTSTDMHSELQLINETSSQVSNACQIDKSLLNSGQLTLDPLDGDSPSTQGNHSQRSILQERSETQNNHLKLNNDGLNQLDALNADQTCNALDKPMPQTRDVVQTTDDTPVGTHTFTPLSTNTDTNIPDALTLTTNTPTGFIEQITKFTQNQNNDDKNNADPNGDQPSTPVVINQAPETEDMVFHLNVSELAKGVTLKATDADGDPLAFSEYTDPAVTFIYDPVSVNSAGEVTLNIGDLNGGNGLEMFKAGQTYTTGGQFFTKDDHGNESNISQFKIIIHGENDAPTANNATLTVREEDLFLKKFNANPPDPDFNYQLNDLVDDPDNDAATSVSFDANDVSFAVWDGSQFVDTAATVTYNAGNNTYSVSSANPLLDDFSFSSNNGLIEIEYQDVSHLGENDQIQLQIHYTATDEHGATDTGDLNINIQGDNIAPYVNDERVVKEDGEIVGRDYAGPIILTPPELITESQTFGVNDIGEAFYNGQWLSFNDFVDELDDIIFTEFTFNAEKILLNDAVDADGDSMTLLGYYLDFGNGSYQYVADVDQSTTLYLLDNQGVGINYFVTDAQGSLLADQQTTFTNMVESLTANVSGTYSTNTLISLGALPGNDHVSTGNITYQADIHFLSAPIGSSPDAQVLYDLANTEYDDVANGTASSGLMLSSLF